MGMQLSTGGLGSPGSSVLIELWSDGQSLASPKPIRQCRLRTMNIMILLAFGMSQALYTTWGDMSDFAEEETEDQRRLRSSCLATK